MSNKEKSNKIEVRCDKCKTLLYIIIEDNGSIIEIKCRKCGKTKTT